MIPSSRTGWIARRAANPPPVIEDRAGTVLGTEALDFRAGRLAGLLAERAAAGLHRGYAERSERDDECERVVHAVVSSTLRSRQIGGRALALAGKASVGF